MVRYSIFRIIGIIIIILSLLSYSTYGQNLEFLGRFKREGWLKVGDTNNDGQNEILYGYGYPSKNPQATILGHDYGQFDALWRADIPFSEAPWVIVDIGDVNNDGENEIIIMNATPHDINPNGKIRIYKHVGSNNYDLLWSETLNEGFYRLAIGNTDDDPENEFVIGHQYYNHTSYIYDYQGGNIWSKSPITSGEDCFGLKIADVDRDGRDEIIAGYGIWPPYSVRIYKYEDGTYNKIWQYSFWDGSPYGPSYWLDVGDTDNDGENEILVCEVSRFKEGNDNDVFIFEYLGANNWIISYSISTGSYPANYGAYSPLIGRILNTSSNQFAFVSMDTIYVYEMQSEKSGTYQQVLAMPIGTKYFGIIDKNVGGLIFGGDADNDGNYEILNLIGSQLFIYRGSSAGISEDNSEKRYSLDLVHLNQYKSSVNIRFNSSFDVKGELNIYDIKGSLIKSLIIQAKKGENEIFWDCKDDYGKIVPSGTYFYRISIGPDKREGKLILL